MIDLFVWPVKEKYIAVKQVSREETTKDGRGWIFYNYLYLNDGTRKNINLKSLRQEMKLLKPKIIIINFKRNSKLQNKVAWL